MRLIYERDEEEEFIEAILSQEEIEDIREFKGVSECRITAREGKIINFFIRRSNDATQERQKQKSHFRKYKRDGACWASSETSSCCCIE